jgi:hypothetical protein
MIAACDDNDDDQQAQVNGGGQGSASANDVVAGSNGFCSPTGGTQSLGDASYNSNSTAKIDTDGDPAMQGHDANWQANTSGQVNGHAINSSQYAYVVMSPTQMAQSGVSLGDWARVTNNATGQQTWARVEDVGPAGGTGEISEAAASAVGIQTQSNGFTVGDPSVSVSAYAGTSAIQGDCQNVASN